MTVEFENTNMKVKKPESLIALALCAVIAAAGVLEQLIRGSLELPGSTAPFWLPPAAAVVAVIGILPIKGGPNWLRTRRWLLWSGLLLMIWLSNGLILDLLRISGLIPLEVDWPGMVIRIMALAVSVILTRLALAHSAVRNSASVAGWYGYAAFVLVLPYPVLRTCWALGATPGLMWPGAAGEGFTPWLACTPWLLAAVLSLLLVNPRRWIPRRLMLLAGWSATAIVINIAPAACWAVIRALPTGGDSPDGIALWVPCLFYGSWLLWAIAACAATRSYQLRSKSDRTGV